MALGYNPDGHVYYLRKIFVGIDDLKHTASTKSGLTVFATFLALHLSTTAAQAASPLAPRVPAAAPAPIESPEHATTYAIYPKPAPVSAVNSPAFVKPAAPATIFTTSSAITPPAAPPVITGAPITTDSAAVIYEQDEDSKNIGRAIAQATSTQPTDLAPVQLPDRTSVQGQMEHFKTSLLYKLPSRMFLAASCENSIRLETNVLQTLSNHRTDLIYRVLPNATVGYALTKTTRISHNYFYFRDQYAHNNRLLSRNIHSIGFRVDQDIPINPRTTATVSFFTRQLLLSRTQPLSDLLPSVSIVRRVGDRTVVYASVLGQIRFRNTLGRFQEGDQFYSLGGIYRLPRWTFLADHTLINNFGNRQLRGGPDNSLFVLTYEAAYKVHPALPLQAFIRAEPIFNMGANQATGFAGFNFRLFGGLRFELAKPPIFPVKIKRR